MASLAEISEKIGGLTAEVRHSREDIQGLTAAQTELGRRVAQVEDQIRTRRLRERLIWAGITTVGVSAWGALGLVPWRFWSALAKAIAGSQP